MSTTNPDFYLLTSDKFQNKADLGRATGRNKVVNFFIFFKMVFFSVKREDAIFFSFFKNEYDFNIKWLEKIVQNC